MGKNKFKVLPINLFDHLTNLKHLYLHNNQLKKCPQLHKLTNLERLMLNGNKLQDLPPDELPPSLKFLDLSGNPISSLPRNSFSMITNLVTLHLEATALQELPDTIFHPLTNLVILKLSNNRIKELAYDTFWPLTKLQTLLLKGNPISELPYNLCITLAGLQGLDLQETNLTYLPNDFFDAVKDPQALEGIALKKYGSGDKPDLTMLKAQQQYCLSILLGDKPDPIELKCGCYGFSSFKMLKQEIELKLKLDSRGCGIALARLCPNTGQYIIFTDISFLNANDKIKIIGKELLIILPDKSNFRFSWISNSLDELKAEIQRRTKLNDVKIKYYDHDFQHYLDFDSISQLRQNTKLKLVLSLNPTKDSQAQESVRSLKAQLQELEKDLSEARQSDAASQKAVSQLKTENISLKNQLDLEMKTIEKYERRDIFKQGAELKSRFWDPFFELTLPWNKAHNKLFSRCALPSHELETDVHNLFYATVSRNDIKISRTEFIQNCCLQERFESTLIIMSKQGHEDPTTPMGTRFAQTPEKQTVLKRFSDCYVRVAPNDKIKVVRTWVGMSITNVEIVCNTGLVDLRQTDRGFFGAGIYSTLQANYARYYAERNTPPNPEGEFCLLLCWVAVGNVYPISRDLDYDRGGSLSHFFHQQNGLALKPGFDSHCACVYLDQHYQAAKMFDADTGKFPQDPGDLVDEIVVKESSQILPYCVVYYKKK